MFHSYIITGNNFEKRQQYIDDFIKNLKISKYDLFNLSENPITIVQIREVKHFLAFKPHSSSHKVVTILADNISHESQQTLLKTLEEPPANSIIILSVNSENSLISTILSRCKIIKIADVINKEDTTTSGFNFWQKLLTQKMGQRLIFTSEIVVDRQSSINWIVEQIFFFRQVLIKNYLENIQIISASQSLHILKKLIITHKQIQNNINLKLSLDNLFLQI